MIKVFDSEEYMEELQKMEFGYLEQFGLLSVDDEGYDDLKVWFEDFKFDYSDNGESATFIDYGYVSF